MIEYETGMAGVGAPAATKPQAGAYAMLCFSVGLVVDDAEDRDEGVVADAGIALDALARALSDAAGVPEHRFWQQAYAALSAFAKRVAAIELSPAACRASYAIRAFLDENADLGEAYSPV